MVSPLTCRHIVDSRAILRADIRFFIGTMLRHLRKSSIRSMSFRLTRNIEISS